MSSPDSLTGRVVLGITHCAGLIDLVALPVWIVALTATYQLDPQQSGSLLTMFLGGGVVASMVVAPWFNRLSGRWVAFAGFMGAALALQQVVHASDFGYMALMHALGGLCIGAALSVKDGTLARSRNPHRLFAILSTALGIFALTFLSVMPSVMASQGGSVLFVVFSAVMVVASVASLLAFPVPATVPHGPTPRPRGAMPQDKRIWFGVVGLCLMSVVQAMSFSFMVQVGVHRGFAAEAINPILAMLGLVNLFIPVAAGLLQNRIAARHVLFVGPLLQAALSFTLYNASSYSVYALAGTVFVAVLIFTHIFAFGFLARLDRSGRVLAGTPAMMMTGAAIGPILAGSLVKFVDYSAIGYAAVTIGVASWLCFQRLTAREPLELGEECA